MSKLVAIIDDEKWVGCPLEHEGYCHIAWNKYYKCMEECDGVLNDRPEFCPLKEYKEAIPVEWLKQLLDDAELAGQPYTINILKRILSRWEKENETN